MPTHEENQGELAKLLLLARDGDTLARSLAANRLIQIIVEKDRQIFVLQKTVEALSPELPNAASDAEIRAVEAA